MLTVYSFNIAFLISKITNMSFFLIKYLITAFVIVSISEIAKHSDKLGALISSLLIVTILVMMWLYIEKQPVDKIANHAFYTFWYVIPTLPMFLIIPFIISKGYPFLIALIVGIVVTFICFIITVYIAGLYGIDLIS